MEPLHEATPVEEFRRGERAASDERTAQVLAEGGVARTAISSPWLFQICPDCHHTFREGDEVQIEPGKDPRHAGPPGECRNTLAPDPMGDAAEFYAGLNEAWPAPEDFHIVRLEAGHELLAGPLGALGRRTCAVCAHTFRPSDLVVICPCSPAAPLCRVAIHRDVIHNMTCWEAWNPGKERTNCPVTSRRLDE